MAKLGRPEPADRPWKEGRGPTRDARDGLTLQSILAKWLGQEEPGGKTLSWPCLKKMDSAAPSRP